MQIEKLRLNHIENPLGFLLEDLSFSWITTDTQAACQKAARLCIASDKDVANILFDSGQDENISSISYLVDMKLSPRTRYYWRVEVWADNGDYAISPVAWFETGKMNEDWQGKWIATSQEEKSPLLRKDFHIGKPIQSARLYATGLGLYEVEINSSKAGDEYLTPGFHSYDCWLQYQTYDVTDLLQEGDNAIGAMLGDGWYKGRFGFDGGYTDLYGDRKAFLCELHLTYGDGTHEVIASDTSWLWHCGFISDNSIYDGEQIDARKHPQDWSMPKLDCDHWENCVLHNPTVGAVSERLSLPVIKHEEYAPVKVLNTPKGELVLDFGKILTGWVAFYNTLPQGKTLRLQYGEIMQNDCFYRDNLRTAKAEFVYISNGNTEWIRPHFTFYGFRYVKIEGMDKADLSHFKAWELYSDIEQTGRIETGNEKVNKLIDNALQSQKGNFLDVPTDCPQRDERMGWTGDAQIFSGTACFNMYSPAFFSKYMRDLFEEQKLLNGSVPHIVPRIKPKHSNGFVDGHGASPWGDAAAIIPWTLYLHYGDISMLRRHYESMKAWVEYLISQDHVGGNNRLIKTGFHFGDWLALDNLVEPDSSMGATDPYYVASVFYFYSTTLLSKAADILGYQEDADIYSRHARLIRKAIQMEYFSPNWKPTISTQTALILAIYFDIIPHEGKERAAKELSRKIDDKNGHLDTGFTGTPYICPALTAMGETNHAYRLLLTESYPGWLYAVNLGATTIWERWDSVMPDGSISGTGMNSLNHYAYGSIVEWIYRDVCGLNPSVDKPGWKRAILRPRPNGILRYAKGAFDSAAGKYICGWQLLQDGQLQYDITIPFDAVAEVWLPDARLETVYINGTTATGAQIESNVKLELPAGEYTINYLPMQDYRPKYDEKYTLEKLMGDSRTNAVLQKYLSPVLNDMADFVEQMKPLPLEKLIQNYRIFHLHSPANNGLICSELVAIPLDDNA